MVCALAQIVRLLNTLPPGVAEQLAQPGIVHKARNRRCHCTRIQAINLQESMRRMT
jgi:hypothetical protein